MASHDSKIERERLGLALLAASAKLAAAQAARERIERDEIIYQLDAIPSLREGVSEKTLAQMIRGGRVKPDEKCWRKFRHPDRETELRDRAVILDALIKEQTELRFWILKELENMEVAA